MTHTLCGSPGSGCTAKHSKKFSYILDFSVFTAEIPIFGFSKHMTVKSMDITDII